MADEDLAEHSAPPREPAAGEHREESDANSPPLDVSFPRPDRITLPQTQL